jgi:predicted MFS family arabinose efflux permease
MALAVVALGLAVALISSPLTALVGGAAPPDARAAVMAAYAALTDVASAAGAILGAATALSAGYRLTYLLTAALVAVATAASVTASRGGR